MMSKAKVLSVASLFTLAIAGSAYAGDNGAAVKPLTGTLSADTGHFICTAAINADGSIAGGEHVATVTTIHLATGQYQVGFNSPCVNVTAANGFMRVAQVDTLSTGSISNVSCTTADRSGVTNAVWVACFANSNGAATDTSFMLLVAR
ncbi:MAG: hypothetical protein ACLPN5_05480 [Roseiarcus sp.]